MNSNEHKLVFTLEKNGKYKLVTWEGNNSPVYLDDYNAELDELEARIDELEAQNRAFARKCAPIRKPKKFNAQQTRRMRRLRAGGASLRCIAREMGCAESTVRNYLK